MSIESLAPFLAKQYDNFPKGRFVSAVILRTTLSETVFRTEGTGEPVCKEFVHAGIESQNVIERLVMTKRKQIAPERRKGREFLRAHELLKIVEKKGKGKNAKTEKLPCSLNTNAPCEMCIDCFTYGFAAGGGGAQKSRIWTEDAFSLLPANELIDDRTINGVYENGTMRLPQKEESKDKPSQSLNTSEYIKPGVHFLDVVTFKDLTADELRYALGNILLTTRYGAISSRTGRMDNQVLGLFGGLTELPSSLELVQSIYDKMLSEQVPFEHPLSSNALKEKTSEVLTEWENRRGISIKLSEADLKLLIADIDEHWADEKRASFLGRLDQSYEPFRRTST